MIVRRVLPEFEVTAPGSERKEMCLRKPDPFFDEALVGIMQVSCTLSSLLFAVIAAADLSVAGFQLRCKGVFYE
jgi:hypothetical protein